MLFLPRSTFQLGYDHSHIDRLTGEKQSVAHVHGHSQQHEPSKDSEAALGRDDILGPRSAMGGRCAGSWARREPTWRHILAGQLRHNELARVRAGRSESWLQRATVLRGSSQAPFRKQVSSLNLSGRRGGWGGGWGR